MMNFLKKLFSSEKENDKEQTSNLAAIYTTETFNNRYTEVNLNENPVVLDGCLKMVDSFFIDFHVDKKIIETINHPVNLDSAVDEGLGFKMYYKAFKFDDSQIVSFLAFAFSDFLINNYGFRLYKDNQPEFPLREMTLKYDKNGVVLSLYPFEYSLKVLNYESTFEDLHNKISNQLQNMPDLSKI